MSLQSLTNSAKAIAASVKYMRHIDTAAKEDNISAAEYLEKKLGDKMKFLVDSLPKDQIKAMEMYRKAVGEDMWATIALNPSLPAMMKSWLEEEVKKIIPQMVEMMSSVLPENHGLTNDEIRLVIFESMAQ